jgi:nicotinamide phosphoribosyltransferase
MSSKLQSIITDTDSYKVSMWKQYPPGTEYVYSYIESRGGKYDRTEFLGVQALAKYLAEPITQEQIDYAEKIWTLHGEPFNREGWQYILDTHQGKLPLRIRAAKEGSIIPTKNVLCTIENTDPKCFWLTTWVETAALRAIWYPTTVGTTSWHIKQEILNYLEMSGDPTLIDFKLHDFGARGVSSEESARLGGAAHLVNFKGTDTMSGILHIMDVYGGDVCGFSIPAAEHSTITSWGRANEVDAYRNMIKQFGGPGKILAVVSDSYDIYKACEMWGTELKDDVINSGATVVIRPDSGDPVDVLPRMFKILGDKFGFVKNAKGYKVLNNVRVIWGDGIDAMSLSSILRTVVDVGGWSADNIAFGMGGGLLQQCNRDTQEFAMKASAVGIREWIHDAAGLLENKIVWREVYKDPITASNKASKKGRVKLWNSGGAIGEGAYETSVDQPRGWADKQWIEVMKTYFEDGEVKFTQTFDQVRANSMI